MRRVELKEGSWAQDDDKKELGFFEEDGNGSWPAKNGSIKFYDEISASLSLNRTKMYIVYNK